MERKIVLKDNIIEALLESVGGRRDYYDANTVMEKS